MQSSSFYIGCLRKRLKKYILIFIFHKILLRIDKCKKYDIVRWKCNIGQRDNTVNQNIIGAIKILNNYGAIQF